MIPVPPWVYAGAAALAVAGGFVAGWQVRSWKAGSDQSAALLAASRALDKAASDINRVSGLYEQEKAEAMRGSIERQTELRTIYHETTIPAECAAPDAARLVLESSVGAANARVGGEPRPAVPDATAAP